VLILAFQVIAFAIFNIAMVWASKKQSNLHKNKQNKFKIALVIPCYNEERVIPKKLDNSIAAISFNPQSSIYVVDDGSGDDTFKLAEEYRVKNNLQNLFVWTNLGESGKPGALNWVFSKLKEDIVVITDADALIEKESICELASNFYDPRVGAATGKLVNRGNNSLTQKEEGLYRRVSEFWRKAESNLDSCIIFNGPLMAFRRELICELKIDERAMADDTDLAYKIRRLGYRSVYEPAAIVSEYITSSFYMRAKQEIIRAKGLTRVIRENIDMFGKFGYFGKILFPFAILNFVLFPILTLFLLFLLPFAIMEYPILLASFLLLLIPAVRTAVLGYLYREMALFIGLVSRSSGRWKTRRK
jgi:poly-beta-1,6-N-acetyl-D-glucosamine synthase